MTFTAQTETPKVVSGPIAEVMSICVDTTNATCGRFWYPPIMGVPAGWGRPVAWMFRPALRRPSRTDN